MKDYNLFYYLKKKLKRLLKDNQEKGEEVEEDKELKCDECEQRRNLWLCLRETCLFVGCGCGKDDNSNKHSTLHAQVFKFSNYIQLN